MEDTCFKMIFWTIVGAIWLFLLFKIIMFFIEQSHEKFIRHRLILESLYRIEDKFENLVQPKSDKSFNDRLKELEEFEVARDLRRRQEEVSCQEFAENLGNRKVGKIGIVIGKDPDKTVLSHPILCNYVGDTIPLYQDETGYFVLHSEEKVYLHDDKNIGHTVRDRENIKQS